MGENDKKASAPALAGEFQKKKWNHHKKKRYAAKPTARVEKFQGGKEELDGNYFDCTGYGQSDRFVKTVQKISGYVGQEYKCGGVSRAEVINQTAVIIPLPPRPTGTSTRADDGAVTTTPPDAFDISNYQSAKKITDYQIQHQKEN